ncbi:MAG: DNA translocase FtsK 4TM domain-containing protein [Balneolales bacterium]
MAKKNNTKKPKEKSRFLASRRKIEVLGVIIMAIAVLLAISIVTHENEDYTVISSVSVETLFQFDSGPALRIQNGLGPMGAYISHLFSYMMFGYTSMVIALLLLVYGWYTFRHKKFGPVHPYAVYLVCVMMLVSAIMGYIQMEGIAETISWSGSSGLAVAEFLRATSGQYGPIVILGSLSIICLLFGLGSRTQDTIDGVKDRFGEIIDERKKNGELAKEKELEESDHLKNDRSKFKDQKDWTENKTKATNNAPETSEKIISRSELNESKLREDKKGEENFGEGKPPKASLEKKKNVGDDDDLEISVYVGKPDEEAGDSDLERKNKDQALPVIKYKFPTLDLLDSPPNEGNEVDFEEIKSNKLIILDKLRRHGIEITAIEAIVGPTVTLYELQPAPDVKISKIESYANDLKMAMATHGLRIIAPIPGKSKVGIEVPNRKREMVYIKSLIRTKRFVETDMSLPIAFGRTIENEVFMIDLATLPHLLMAGATGSGKSVGINTILTCLLYKCHPENLKFVLVDPKKIELALYRNIQNHFLATLPGAEEPIITDTTKVLEVLNSVCKEMDTRYELLKMAMVRDIRSYNEKFKNGSLDEELEHRHLPYMVIVIDELADLMMTAGKAIEEPIARIAQLARAVGIHLVVATQRPSVNVITGTIKANFPARIAYQVASRIDSRTILDTMGADQLVGKGDMLFSGGGKMIRIQNAFVSTEEVERVNGFIGNQAGYTHPYHLPSPDNEESAEVDPLEKGERDDLFEEAAKAVVLHQQGSVSLLQRKLKLGYNRAGRLIDQLYAAGVVGPYQGSTARDVLIETDDELSDLIRELDTE